MNTLREETFECRKFEEQIKPFSFQNLQSTHKKNTVKTTRHYYKKLK